jgi:hypothetical protein
MSGYVTAASSAVPEKRFGALKYQINSKTHESPQVYSGNAHQIARALGGKVCGRNKVAAPGPGHSKHDNSMVLTLLSSGYVVHSFSGDDWQTCRDHINDRLGLGQFRPGRSRVVVPSYTFQPLFAEELKPRPGPPTAIVVRPAPAPTPDVERVAKFERAKRLWTESAPLPSTLGWHYLTEIRGLAIDRLGDLSHALKWHDGERAIIARVVDPLRNEGTGVHRVYLNGDGTKDRRLLLAGSGVIKLTADEDVTTGLHIAEGIEKSLALMLCGLKPMWCAVSAGEIAKLPVLNGIDCLSIMADAGNAGERAAAECRQRWESAHREVVVSFPSPKGIST